MQYQLLPDLAEDEYAALKADIAKRGVQVPVEYDEDGNILDGHHRVRACEELGITSWPRVVRLGMDEEAKTEHILALNLDRRHLTKAQRQELVYKLRAQGWSTRRIADGLHISNFTVHRDLSGVRNLTPDASVDADMSDASTDQQAFKTEHLAPATVTGADGKQYPARQAPKPMPVSLFNASEREVLKAREVQAAALSDPNRFGDLPEKMDEKSVDSAFREYRRRQAKETPPLPSDKYRVIYADPPWYYAQSVDGYGPADRHYPTMETEAICALPVADLAEDNAVLFLWATSPKLVDALGVAEAWGFRYSGAMFVWDKVDHNYGHYNSVRHELLLICTRGSCTPDERTLFDSVQSIKRTEHSEKPEEFRQMIDKLYTHGRRIELFARGQHDGWDVWGQDAERDSS